VAEARGYPDLPEEPRRPSRHGLLDREHLDGDRPLVAEVARGLDGRQAPAAHLAVELVTLGERLTQPFDQSVHTRQHGGRGSAAKGKGPAGSWAEDRPRNSR
jgi:hypothetical protein